MVTEQAKEWGIEENVISSHTFIRHCHTDSSADNNSFISDRAQKSDSILFVVHIFSFFEYMF